MDRLFGVLPALLSELGTNDGAAEAVALAAWAQCAGELIAERTKALEYFEKRLIVAVRDETWAAHLQDLGPTLVAKLNGTLGQGSVTFVEFRVDSKAFGSMTAAADLPDLIDPPASLVDAANAISDETLRDNFLKAAAISLTKS